MRELSPDLLEILRCPHCVTQPGDPPKDCQKGQLRYEKDRLTCLQCGRSYKVEDGIPDMIVEHAVLPGQTGNPAN